MVGRKLWPCSEAGPNKQPNQKDNVSILEVTEIKQEPVFKEEPKYESDEEIKYVLSSDSDSDQMDDENGLEIDSTRVKREVKEGNFDTNLDQEHCQEEESKFLSPNDSKSRESEQNRSTPGSKEAKETVAIANNKSKTNTYSYNKKETVSKENNMQHKCNQRKYFSSRQGDSPISITMELEHNFVMDERKNNTFLYIFSEKQLYTFNANGKFGKIYRCAKRQCKARRVFNENEKKCLKLVDAQEHNHSDDCETRYTNLLALETMKNIAQNLHSVASGSRLIKSHEIFKQAIIQHQNADISYDKVKRSIQRIKRGVVPINSASDSTFVPRQSNIHKPTNQTSAFKRAATLIDIEDTQPSKRQKETQHSLICSICDLRPCDVCGDPCGHLGCSVCFEEWKVQFRRKLTDKYKSEKTIERKMKNLTCIFCGLNINGTKKVFKI